MTTDKNQINIVSFSYKPQDMESLKAVEDLKEYGKKRGISFSFLVIKSIKNYLKNEINNVSEFSKN